MVEAYRYAAEIKDEDTPPPQPQELILLSYIDRFGAEAITGNKVLGFGDIKRMVTAENIVLAYKDRKSSNNWGDWAAKNPSASRLLKKAELLASEEN